MSRPTPPDVIAEIRRLYADGVPVARIVKQTGTSNGAIYNHTRDLPRRSPQKPHGTKHRKRTSASVNNTPLGPIAGPGWGWA